MLTYAEFQAKTGLTGTALIAGWKKYQAEDAPPEDEDDLEDEPTDSDAEEEPTDDDPEDEEDEDMIDENEKAQKASALARLRTGRGQCAGYTGAQMPNLSKVKEASMLMAMGIHGDRLEADYGQRVLDTATSVKHRLTSFHSLFTDVYRQNGERAPSKWSDASIRRAFEFAAIGGPSTSSLGGLLSNVANKLLKEAYMMGPQSWRSIASISSVADFKESKRYRLGGSGELKQVPAAGELKHVGLSEQSFTNQAATYGAVYGIDRRDLINDDLGAFASVGSWERWRPLDSKKPSGRWFSRRSIAPIYSTRRTETTKHREVPSTARAWAMRMD